MLAGYSSDTVVQLTSYFNLSPGSLGKRLDLQLKVVFTDARPTHLNSKHIFLLLSLLPNWLPLPLLLQASVSPLPWKQRGGNTRLRVRGQGEPIRTTGEKACHSVYSVGPFLTLKCICNYLFHFSTQSHKYLVWKTHWNS
jgi:hypothetical protein